MTELPGSGIDGTDPSDNTTLVTVLDGYRADGFDGDFHAEDGARVRCGRCQTSLDARDLSTVSMRRMEGASDPADMMAVVATSCPVCGGDGTLVLGYGPMASETDSDVLLALRDRRDTGAEPPASSTAEVPVPEVADLPSGGDPPTDSTLDIVTDQNAG